MMYTLLTSSSGTQNSSNPWSTIIFMVILVAVFVVMMVMNRRSQKKRQEETQTLLDSLKPGNKVKTIGGICGVVVEVCRDDNTFVMETGTEKSGKSILKFDMQAIYQTDAVAEKTAEAKEVKTEKQPEPAKEVKAEEVKTEETEPAKEDKAE